MARLWQVYALGTFHTAHGETTEISLLSFGL